ncbi:TPA: ProQ/FINO family protein [Escherichia coli]
MTEPTRPILTIKRRNRTVYVPPEKAAKSEPQPAERTTSKAKVQPKAKAPQKPAQKPTAAKPKKTPEQVAEGIRRQEENDRRQQDIAIANKSKKALANRVTKAFLKEHWPDLLTRGVDRRPMAKGIIEQILTRGAELDMPPEADRKAVRRILGIVTGTSSYQQSLIDQCMRYDLDGNPTEPATPEEAENAKARLTEIKAFRRKARQERQARDKKRAHNAPRLTVSTPCRPGRFPSRPAPRRRSTTLGSTASSCDTLSDPPGPSRSNNPVRDHHLRDDQTRDGKLTQWPPPIVVLMARANAC